MKRCISCEEVLSEENTYKKPNGNLQSYCKKCFNRYCADRWKQRKLDAIAYKGGKCERCGYDKYYGALEFHHLDPLQKDCDWNKMRKKKWQDVLAELDKCICVCSNCHREIHMAT